MRTSILSLCALVSSVAFADAGVYSVKTGESTVTYHVVHKLHKVDGVSKKVEGRAKIVPGGPTQVAIRVPIESFDSDNVNRDAHMKEVTEAAKYPTVEVKALGDGIALPATFPAEIKKSMKAQVNFHGITQNIDVPVTIKFEAADKVIVTTSFSLSLDAYKVERPSLVFVKIDDALVIDAKLVLVP
jgi:hypothetical protein